MEDHPPIPIDQSAALADEPLDTIVSETICPEARGDGYDTPRCTDSSFDISNIEVASLCSVDKMRIDHLLSELDKCRESRKETELQLAANKSKNEAMQKIFESYNSRQEDEKTDLKSKLAAETCELKELTTNTSYSLDNLADQISAWQIETALIRDTVNELLCQKINLHKEMNRMEVKMMLLTAEESRITDILRMNKLHFTKDELKSDIMMILTHEKGCQTEEITIVPVNYV